MRALEKDPARRFADADAFIAALEAVRERIVSGGVRRLDGGLPSRARVAPDYADPELAEDPDRRSWPWILAVALVVLAAAGALIFALIAARASASRSRTSQGSS